MPAVSHRGARRRTINEINMVPFIDVMLVLLIIFMVTAPLITTGLVELPSVGKSKQRPEHVIEVVVAADEVLKLRLDGKDAAPVVLRGELLDEQQGCAHVLVQEGVDVFGGQLREPLVAAPRVIDDEDVDMAVSQLDGLSRDRTGARSVAKIGRDEFGLSTRRPYFGNRPFTALHVAAHDHDMNA